MEGEQERRAMVAGTTTKHLLVCPSISGCMLIMLCIYTHIHCTCTICTCAFTCSMCTCFVTCSKFVCEHGHFLNCAVPIYLIAEPRRMPCLKKKDVGMGLLV